MNGTIHNFWADNYYSTKTWNKSNISSLNKFNLQLQKKTQKQKSENWFWEVNVQSRVITFLISQKYQIRSVADTATHQTDIDIIAEKNENKLWVSVKGFPQGTEKTNASAQSRHWFKHAIFDIIEYRERDKEAFLVVAFPDFPSYRNLAKKLSWFKAAARFVYIWVSDGGKVVIE